MIYIDGGSNTYGEELPDRLTQAWPFLLQTHVGLPVVNQALQGKSNQHIMFDLVNFCSIHRPKLVVLGWVNVSRKMFVRRENNYVVDLTASSSNSTYKNSKELTQFQNLLYRYWSNYLYDMWQFLQTVVVAQSFLKSHNIPYLMFNDVPQHDVLRLLTISSQSATIKNHLLDAFDQMNDDQILQIEKHINSTFAMIDQANYHDFSWHFGKLVDLEDGTKHPTAEDHLAIMQFFLPKIRDKL
jgi:hypothetical protein